MGSQSGNSAPGEPAAAEGHKLAARLALAAELPASVLADLTGISSSAAERWSQLVKRDWAAYVAERSTSS